MEYMQNFIYIFLLLNQAMIYRLVFTGGVNRAREENARRALYVFGERRRLIEENYRQMEQHKTRPGRPRLWHFADALHRGKVRRRP